VAVRGSATELHTYSDLFRNTLFYNTTYSDGGSMELNQLRKKYYEVHPESEDLLSIKKNAQNKINSTYHYYTS
jgi:hypothetical protein